ncbi:MAG: NADPH-dependent assimilatory sulfite reductase hemoprotein subunit [Planctomycetia bacterium]|nr:NADPH-dependent assimilatory sulfite reductase hemoprotein subunit [Planctomycetia bacterium]
MNSPEKLSPVEGLKTGSNFLRGTIAQELASDVASFGKESGQLLKHHGTYQQDDRDTRKVIRDSGKTGKKDKSFSMMVRTKIPGGKLTSAQLLSELDLCDEVGNTTLRITTRQGLQLHGVLKSNLQHTIRRINEVQMSTLGACGDVNRNVMCCPAPHYGDPVHQQLQDLADQLASYFAPRTTAYHEIWLTDEDHPDEPQLVGGGSDGHEIEPIYGNRYLPRKFKMAIGLPSDNCADIYANDLGLMAICDSSQIIGYNVVVGGGFGVTPSAAKTFPAVAKRLTFVTPDQVIDVSRAIVEVQRDYGDRSDRKRARMKYVIADWGLDKFKAKVEEYYGHSLPAPNPEDVQCFDDHLGWNEQGDGRWYYGLNVENGRIKDEGELRLKSALRQICTTLRPAIRLTSNQSILFCDVAAEDKAALEKLLTEHGVKLTNQISTVRRWSIACPAMPTCGLAVAESERALPGIIDQLEVELARLGLSDEVFTVRMTGCPNGCARPYNSDVGLVGKTLGKYTILVGGRVVGDRLNFLYKDLVAEADVVPTLVPLLIYFKQERTSGESFGDFCHRKGADDLAAWADNYAAQSTT